MPQVSSWIRMTVTALAVAAAVVAGWYLWRTYEESPWTRDGRVRANVVMVAPDVAGALVDIRVRDNQEVRIGDVLFVVDPARYKLAVVQAEAMLAGARSVLEQRQEEQARRERLSAASISQEALTQARTATLSAQADYDRAEAALGVAKLNLARTEVRSPVNGHVTNLLIGRGDYAECVRLILPVRAIAHTFGGSHAQRDVLELTLLEAALRGGDMALGHRLALERAAARPSSPLSRLFVSRGNSAPTPS